MRKILFPAVAVFCLLLFSACTYLPEETDAEAFSFSELAHVFALTESEIFETFGQPDEERISSFQGVQANEFRYGKNSFCAEAASGYVYAVCLYDDTLEAPRGVTIGMKIEDLVPLFLSSGEETMYTSPDGEHYRLLYGTYESGGDYGVILYDGRTPVLVEYSSEGCVFACGIQSGKVEYVEFFVE